jgi:hypothetical protein
MDELTPTSHCGVEAELDGVSNALLYRWISAYIPVKAYSKFRAPRGYFRREAIHA